MTDKDLAEFMLPVEDKVVKAVTVYKRCFVLLASLVCAVGFWPECPVASVGINI